MSPPNVQHGECGIRLLVHFVAWREPFQFLTSTNHYLAVLHPIIYMELRSQQRKRIRRIAIGCICLVSFGILCLMLDKIIA